MGWERLGWVDPPADRPWRVTHAALPYGVALDTGRFRVFFSGRDEESRSWITSGVLDIRAGPVWEELDNVPILAPGEEAAFDGAGVSVGCALAGGDEFEVWYHGWALGRDVPWWNSVGAAHGRPESEFRRLSRAPVFDRSDEDPFGHAYPFRVVIDGTEELWYSSYARWAKLTDDPPMEFVVKRARLVDGRWQHLGRVLGAEPPEFAATRPCVIVEDGLWKLWFATRGEHYRIAYAESTDGLQWRRMDDAGGLEPAGSGGECLETTYPHVVDAWGERWMFYNGDGYGRSGFGVAVWS